MANLECTTDCSNACGIATLLEDAKAVRKRLNDQAIDGVVNILIADGERHHMPITNDSPEQRRQRIAAFFNAHPEVQHQYLQMMTTIDVHMARMNVALNDLLAPCAIGPIEWETDDGLIDHICMSPADAEVSARFEGGN